MSERFDQVKVALADRYKIERLVGRGGMATVYLAYDSRHDRNVAIKVLRPELAAAIGSDRFLREIRITAKLNHPHILPLLDSGEVGDLVYYVMPYVAGGSLRACLSRDAPLDLDLVLHVTRQVGSALDYAHGRGVVHRDIKPENVLFSEGHPIVADFGIARAISSAGPESLTRSGVPLGTPGYMSPEQARGITELDARTDVYSLACMVYEMLVGTPPTVWPTEESLRLGRLIDAPAEHRELLDTLPGRVEQALTRALAVRPTDRFATASEFADALVAALQHRPRLADTAVREILARAVQLEEQDPKEAGALSLGAVEQVAAEVGIAPQYVREAAGQLSQRAATAQAESWSARTPKNYEYRRDTLMLDRTVEGEVTTAEFPKFVELIQSTLGIAGHVSVLGKSLTWSPAAPGTEERKIVIAVTSDSNQTHIHVEERLEMSGWRIFIPGWGVGGGIILGVLAATALGAPERVVILSALTLGAVGAFTSVRWFFRLAERRSKPQLSQLADRLAALVEGAAQPRLAAKPEPAERGGG